MNLNNVSDNLIRDEFKKRFTIPIGREINDSSDTIDHLRQYFRDSSQESLVVMFLNGRNALIATETLSTGTLATSAVYPRELIKRVLKNQAAAVILAHNHPSGELKPSKMDISITKKLKYACSTIDVLIHDHLIITGDSYFSFSDNCLI